MIKIECVETYGWEAALRGMRNPLNSWDKSDSVKCEKYYVDGDCKNCKDDSICPNGHGADCLAYCIIHNSEDDELAIGPNDHALMMRLRKAGKDHRKFMRMIYISMDITAPTYWWLQFDTYKVGTVKDSCSKMHCIHIAEITPDAFSHDSIDEVGGIAKHGFDASVNACEWLRQKFNETHEKKYWRALIQLLPEGYNLKATISMTYEVAANMHQGRHNHKIQEWHEFCDTLETLPVSELITGKEELT